MPFNLFRRGTVEVSIPLTEDWRTDVDSSVIAYRSGNVVTVAAWRLAVKAGVVPRNEDPSSPISVTVPAFTLPPGYKPAGLTQEYTRDSRGRNVALNYNGAVLVTDPAASVSHHSFTFVTLDPMPTGGA